MDDVTLDVGGDARPRNDIPAAPKASTPASPSIHSSRAQRTRHVVAVDERRSTPSRASTRPPPSPPTLGASRGPDGAADGIRRSSTPPAEMAERTDDSRSGDGDVDTLRGKVKAPATRPARLPAALELCFDRMRSQLQAVVSSSRTVAAQDSDEVDVHEAPPSRDETQNQAAGGTPSVSRRDRPTTSVPPSTPFFDIGAILEGVFRSSASRRHRPPMPVPLLLEEWDIDAVIDRGYRSSRAASPSTAPAGQDKRDASHTTSASRAVCSATGGAGTVTGTGTVGHAGSDEVEEDENWLPAMPEEDRPTSSDFSFEDMDKHELPKLTRAAIEREPYLVIDFLFNLRAFVALWRSRGLRHQLVEWFMQRHFYEAVLDKELQLEYSLYMFAPWRKLLGVVVRTHGPLYPMAQLRGQLQEQPSRRDSFCDDLSAWMELCMEYRLLCGRAPYTTGADALTFFLLRYVNLQHIQPQLRAFRYELRELDITSIAQLQAAIDAGALHPPDFIDPAQATGTIPIEGERDLPDRGRGRGRGQGRRRRRGRRGRGQGRRRRKPRGGAGGGHSPQDVARQRHRQGMTAAGKSDNRCWWCNETGHFKADCKRWIHHSQVTATEQPE